MNIHTCWNLYYYCTNVRSYVENVRYKMCEKKECSTPSASHHSHLVLSCYVSFEHTTYSSYLLHRRLSFCFVHFWVLLGIRIVFHVDFSFLTSCNVSSKMVFYTQTFLYIFLTIILVIFWLKELYKGESIWCHLVLSANFLLVWTHENLFMFFFILLNIHLSWSEILYI